MTVIISNGVYNFLLFVERTINLTKDRKHAKEILEIGVSDSPDSLLTFIVVI